MGGIKKYSDFPPVPVDCCHACAHLGREELRDQALPVWNVKKVTFQMFRLGKRRLFLCNANVSVEVFRPISFQVCFQTLP